MSGQDDRPAGDDKVRAQPRGGRKIEAPIVDVRLPDLTGVRLVPQLRATRTLTETGETRFVSAEHAR